MAGLVVSASASQCWRLASQRSGPLCRRLCLLCELYASGGASLAPQPRGSGKRMEAVTKRGRIMHLLGLGKGEHGRILDPDEDSPEPVENAKGNA
ncbi:hypothetical protein CCMA1212_006524 [Trichoderma ghanense]|uniref:Uncharacterized protein n=1 Tax=Trichoderma ghanense TaxID=65468 RepID=A0ABY2H2D6_9HYPO